MVSGSASRTRRGRVGGEGLFSESAIFASQLELDFPYEKPENQALKNFAYTRKSANYQTLREAYHLAGNMPSIFQDAFTHSSAIAAVLLITLVLHVALAGSAGWKCRVGGIVHFIGVLTQGYVGWTALDAFVASQTETSRWLHTLRGTSVNFPFDAYLPMGNCGPLLDALLLVISLHIARLMWNSIRPRECAEWFTATPKASNKKSSI
jgi:hypothetical protein